MKKYTNINQYLANNQSILSPSSPNPYTDRSPTRRRPNLQDQIRSGRSNLTDLKRNDTRQTIVLNSFNGDRSQRINTSSPYDRDRSSEKSLHSKPSQRVLNENSRREGVSPSRGRERGGVNEGDWQREMQTYICKLKDVRENLQTQIKQLQHMLDETSISLDKMDKQFQKVKFRILDYTSRCLDTAFVSYKKNMTRWSKYEDIQKKGLKLIEELSQYIQEQQEQTESVKQGNANFNLSASLKETVNRTAHYTFMTHEIRKVRKECLAKHPTLKEEKILQFESSLHELCCF